MNGTLYNNPTAVGAHGPPVVDVIIPARDEAETIAGVVHEIPRTVVRGVYVADNGSTDDTARRARDAGAVVVPAPNPGYGNACLAALAALPSDADIVVFLVADGSDDPTEIQRVIAPLVAHTADLVIGSRFRGTVAPGSMTRFQVVGSLVAAGVLSLRFRQVTTDLGPFRALRRRTVDALAMGDKTYGWTLEMQVKAARAGLRVVEVPVSWRHRRGGQPKVAGTWKGTLGASRKILAWLKGAVLGPTHDPR